MKTAPLFSDSFFKHAYHNAPFTLCQQHFGDFVRMYKASRLFSAFL